MLIVTVTLLSPTYQPHTAVLGSYCLATYYVAVAFVMLVWQHFAAYHC